VTEDAAFDDATEDVSERTTAGHRLLVRGVYVRTMDDRLLPEIEGQPADSPERRR
jgi:hypothetical protein